MFLSYALWSCCAYQEIHRHMLDHLRDTRTRDYMGSLNKLIETTESDEKVSKAWRYTVLEAQYASPAFD